MSHYHCVTWIDHHEAHVIEFGNDEVEAQLVRSSSPHVHLHHKRGVIGAGNAPADSKYFQAIAEAISDAGEILIVGPSDAKLEFVAYLRRSKPAVAARVAGIETADHPTERELLKLARHYFDAKDRMLSQT